MVFFRYIGAYISCKHESFSLYLRRVLLGGSWWSYEYAFICFPRHRLPNPKEFISSGKFLFILKYLRMAVLLLFFYLSIIPCTNIHLNFLFLIVSVARSACTQRTVIIFSYNYITILSIKSAWLYKFFHRSDNHHYMSCHLFFFLSYPSVVT